MTRKDWIRVKDLLVDVLLFSGARWPAKVENKAVLQPISLTISVPTDITHSAEHDDLNSSINYSAIASSIRNLLAPPTAFNSLDDISNVIYDFLLLQTPFSSQLEEAHLSIVQIKPPLHCSRVVLESSGTRTDPSTWKLGTFRHILEDIDCHAIIGVNPAERLEKQVARVHIIVEDHAHEKPLDTRALIRRIYSAVGETTYLTLEALTSYAALQALIEINEQASYLTSSPSVHVKISKPHALVFASASEVEISRTCSDYPPSHFQKMQIESVDGVFTAAIAFGSNLGDSFHNIELALRLLEAPGDLLASCKGKVDIVNTSFLYESTPMYVEDQPKFINGACLVVTDLLPRQLLEILKIIEKTVGRIPSIRNGPRAVDLDIIFYGDQVIDTRAPDERANLENLEGHLVVPHPRLCEREFVIRPLHDMIPDFVHPTAHETISALFSKVPRDPSLQKVLPVPAHPLQLGDSVPSSLCHWTQPLIWSPGQRAQSSFKTQLMAIINTTPDSFSDGADHDSLSTAIAFAHDAVTSGADILDIGGYSTRPGAAFVSVEEEIQRVVPVIEAIRHGGVNVPISVDTFRPEVARAAILAGANIINDVYAFSGPTCYPYPDEDANDYMGAMKKVAREFAVPVVLMHSRADAGSNKDYSAYGYAGKGQSVVEGVRIELGQKVEDIVKGPSGLRRWLVIVDPGVGFSKTVEGNLEVLRESASVTAEMLVGRDSDQRRNPLEGYPSLIGSSRKSFLGTILSQHGRTTTPKERMLATAATVASAVQQGAAIIRVHDVQEMADVIRVSSGIW